MDFYGKLLEYRRLAYILVALAVGHLLVVAVAVYLVIRYQQLWAIPVVLWLPLTILPFRVTSGWLRQVFAARDDDIIAATGIAARQPVTVDSQVSELLDNVVEEIAVATGSDQPDAMVCDSPSLNVFISPGGNQAGQGAIVVFTTAMAASLNRQQLQGVAASLFAHLRNFDRMFISMVGAMYFSVFAAADIFLLLNALNWHYGGSGDFNTGPLVVLLVLGMLAAPLAASRLAQTLVMRRGRFGDDAAAVEITRDPESLIAALKLLAAGEGRLDAAANAANIHFFFAAVNDPVKKFNYQTVATHPSVKSRIRMLESLLGGPAG